MAGRPVGPLVLPADGGSVAPPKPAPAPGTATRRASTPKAPAVKKPTKPADRPVAICPNCFMALTATGVCDYCAG